MLESEVVQKVRGPFHYLFERYGYRAIACRVFANEGNWTLVLESASCGRCLVMQDRGEIIVALGTHGSPTSATDSQWFDLAVVVEHLSQGEEMVHDRLLADPEQQMARLASILRPYMDQIAPLFTSAGFHRAEENLNRIGTRREEEIWDQQVDDEDGEGNED